MIADEKQRKEFEALVRPVIKFLCDNYHPHVEVVITPTRAELLEGVCSIVTTDYIKD